MIYLLFAKFYCTFKHQNGICEVIPILMSILFAKNGISSDIPFFIIHMTFKMVYVPHYCC